MGGTRHQTMETTMPHDTPRYTSPQPVAVGAGDGRRARIDSDARARHFTTRRDSDSLIERIVFEHARSLRPSRRPRTHARVAHAAMLDNSPHRC
jgi:hypothetical protein